MYFINKHDELSYGESVRYALPDCGDFGHFVLKQKGDVAIVYYNSGRSSSNRGHQSVYLYVDGELIKTLECCIYRMDPCVDFIGDYFILYNSEKDLGLYNFKGDFVKSIPFRFEMVRGIHVINDEYFILFGWMWQPFFFQSLYNFNEILGGPHKGYDITNDIEDDEFITLSRDEAIEIEEKQKANEYDRKNQITLRRKFYENKIVKQIFEQKSSPYIQYTGDSSLHLKLFNEQAIDKLSCHGGDSGRDYKSNLIDIIRFKNIDNLYIDILKMVHPSFGLIPSGTVIHQIITLTSKEIKAKMVIKYTIHKNSFNGSGEFGKILISFE